MDPTRGSHRRGLVGVTLLFVALVVAPSGAGTAAVELMRWQEPTLGPHLSFPFVLPPSAEYTDHYFGTEGGGPGAPDDAAVGWVRVRVISSSELVCTGLVVHPGSGVSDVFRPCDLRTGHHYHLDWFVDSPDAAIVLYGRDDSAA